jgi:fatty-acyl-CoA synthase
MSAAPVAPPFSRHVAELCRERATLTPDAPAVVSGDVELTYVELDERVDRAAGALASLGVGEGTTVGLLCTNRWEWLAVALGAQRLGARVAAFNTFAKAWDLDYMLEHSGTEVLVTVDRFRARDYVETVRELVPEVGTGLGWTSARYPRLRDVVVVGDAPDEPGLRHLDALLEQAVPAPPVLRACAVDDAFVLYTSGSSARPKGVPMQHYAAIENGFQIGRRMRLRADDRVWISVPLFWAYGAVNALPATLTHGAAMVLQPAFDAAEALDLIERHRCTVAYTLPNITNALLAEPAFSRARTRTLRTGLTLGSPGDLRRAAEDLGIPEICNIYGSTETYGNCCVTPSEWPLERRLVSQGPPLPGVTLRIADPLTGGDAAPGAPGELLVSGYTARAYLGADDAANAVFGSDGWFRTGDLAVLDDDGCLRFAARATEMIKTGGINVAPSEVEEFLALHPAVAVAAVVGVPDAVAGEAVVAFVIPIAEADVGADELRAFCVERIARYKVPARIHLVDELPKTDTGKLARNALVEADATRPAIR